MEYHIVPLFHLLSPTSSAFSVRQALLGVARGLTLFFFPVPDEGSCAQHQLELAERCAWLLLIESVLCAVFTPFACQMQQNELRQSQKSSGGLVFEWLSFHTSTPVSLFSLCPQVALRPPPPPAFSWP